MADEKVSQLTEATSLGNNDLFYVVKDGVSEKIKYSNVEKNFTLKNVELGGLPTNWWDTSNPDGELYLYRYVEEDDGMVDPYFSVTKDGIEFDEYIANPDQGTVSGWRSGLLWQKCPIRQPDFGRSKTAALPQCAVSGYARFR